ncbi:hypothetical protein Taro_027345 [Colocasia esculenta]|uniref:TF-B3 domain-containing protein n=1 Tax=Colocasia esculenta TaxID=4460 RepID=A0A843V8G0_COLES|nr:hypothetical protein [Colocasia esculenta]
MWLGKEGGKRGDSKKIGQERGDCLGQKKRESSFCCCLLLPKRDLRLQEKKRGGGECPAFGLWFVWRFKREDLRAVLLNQQGPMLNHVSREPAELTKPYAESVSNGSMASGAKGSMSWQENSLSSQESSNHRDEHVQSNGYRNPDCTRMQEPLSGHPYFTCILSRSNVQNQFQLVIPTHFCPLLPAEVVPVVLCCGNKTWNMSYIGDRSLRRFDAGWRNFAVDNDLKIGDGCIFELEDGVKLKFKVQILDGKIPVDNSVKGESSDAPIIIN